jgi:hypothetical protein
MSNLKSITELPLAEFAEGLNLIVNDGGAAKQIPAGAVGAQADWNEADENSPSFIQNKPTKLGGYNRELVYEKSFTAEDEVYDLMEADASFKVFFEDGVDLYSEIETYGFNITQDEPTDEFSSIVTGQHSCLKAYNVIFMDGNVIDTFNTVFEGHFFLNEFSNNNGDTIGLSTCGGLFLLNKFAFTEAGPGPDENNCMLTMFSDSDNPFKSVKLYKITY